MSELLRALTLASWWDVVLRLTLASGAVLVAVLARAAGEEGVGAMACGALRRRVRAGDAAGRMVEPRCHGRMKIIATVTDLEAARKILECIGLPARPPPVAPAREREQAELGFEG